MYKLDGTKPRTPTPEPGRRGRPCFKARPQRTDGEAAVASLQASGILPGAGRVEAGEFRAVRASGTTNPDENSAETGG